jgi:hypothetical protein
MRRKRMRSRRGRLRRSCCGAHRGGRGSFFAWGQALRQGLDSTVMAGTVVVMWDVGVLGKRGTVVVGRG